MMHYGYAGAAATTQGAWYLVRGTSRLAFAAGTGATLATYNLIKSKL